MLNSHKLRVVIASGLIALALSLAARKESGPAVVEAQSVKTTRPTFDSTGGDPELWKKLGWIPTGTAPLSPAIVSKIDVVNAPVNEVIQELTSKSGVFICTERSYNSPHPNVSFSMTNASIPDVLAKVCSLDSTYEYQACAVGWRIYQKNSPLRNTRIKLTLDNTTRWDAMNQFQKRLQTALGDGTKVSVTEAGVGGIILLYLNEQLPASDFEGTAYEQLDRICGPGVWGAIWWKDNSLILSALGGSKRTTTPLPPIEVKGTPALPAEVQKRKEH